MKKGISLALAVASIFAVEAKVQFGVPFTDGAVLQRDRVIPVWGTADAGEKVLVKFADQKVETVAKADGSWRVDLQPIPANACGRDLQANEAVIHDVLVGEVWFCAGQSNTELPLCGSNPHFRDGKGALRAMMTHKPLVRFCFQSNYRISTEPKKTAALPVVWKKFTPKNLMGGASFSAMGVYFALELYNALGIPVGIVGTYWGGTRVEPWTPVSGFEAVPSCKALGTQKLLDYTAYEAAKNAKQVNYRIQDQPRVLWNEMVAPWLPYAIKGFIWYQGCSNAGEGHGYADKMHALYRGWAKEFANPDLKLYFVQLAPWGYPGIATIQEGQAIFAAAEKNAGMAVICDRGNLADIHPNDKETVGMRLAVLALKRDYGFTALKADSPTLKNWKIEGDTFVLSFNDAEGWYLYNPDFSSKTAFEIAGADGKFVPARIVNLEAWGEKLSRSNGNIRGKDLIIRADGVKEPKKLRYLFSHPWFGGLYNEANLPLGAFHIGD